jgi:hypothetical protein
VIGVNPARLPDQDKMPKEMESLKPLLTAQSAVVVIDARKELVGAARLTFAKEDVAKAGEKAAQAALDLAKMTLPGFIASVDREPINKDPVLSKLIASMKDIQAALKDAAITRKGASVQGNLTVKTANPASVLGYFIAGTMIPVNQPRDIKK